MRDIQEAHWRDSARSAKFFIWDVKAAFPLLILLIYANWWTLGIAVFAMMFFSVLNRFGFSISVFGRWLRSSLAGSRKQSRPGWME